MEQKNGVGIRDLDYSNVPEKWRGGLQRYFEFGIEPGSGLRAVLENDLIEAIGRIYDGMDTASLGDDLVALARFLYNEPPGRGSGSVWGSHAAVAAWLALDWTDARSMP